MSPVSTKTELPVRAKEKGVVVVTDGLVAPAELILGFLVLDISNSNGCVGAFLITVI